MSSAVEESPDSDRRLPHGLMSLSEMVNFHLSSVCRLFAQLMLEVVTLRTAIEQTPDLARNKISESEEKRSRGWLQVATHAADQGEWKAVHDRIEIFHRKLDRGITHQDHLAELRVLKETIDKGLDGQLVYRYPAAKKQIIFNWKTDWAAALKKFPSASQDIVAAVDLWALGHSTASVFHFMRVLEHGLRALAADVGKAFDVQNWQNIIDQIESEIRYLRKTMAAGQAKSNVSNFYRRRRKNSLTSRTVGAITYLTTERTMTNIKPAAFWNTLNPS
jgi:hypothetical protein